MDEKISPKLKNTITKIRKILEEEDIAGLIVLHLPGFSEYLLRTNPKYSCMELVDQGEEFKVKIKANSKDFKSTAEMNRSITNTSDMLYRITQTGGEILYPLFEISENLDKKMKEQGIHISHD